MRALLNPANAITAARFIGLPLFLYWIDHEMYQWAKIPVLWAGFLDLFDGAVARALGCETAFGEIFDAVADALIYGFFIAVLTVYGRIPWVPVAGILALGAANSVLRAVYARRAGRATNYRSYAMERTVGYAVYLAGFGVADFMIDYYAYGCLAVMAVVVAHDSKRMLVDPVPS